VSVSGKSLGATPVKPYRTVAGDLTVTVTAPGYVVFSEDTTLAEGQTTTIDANLKKAATDQVSADSSQTPFDNPKTTPPPAPVETSHGSGVRTLAWVSGTVGLVSLGVGMLFFGLAVADKNDADPRCPGKVCDATGIQKINEAWTFSTVSTVLVIVGAVGLATSVVSFIVTPKSAPVQARLFLTPAFAGVGGSF
jgi:hypothetical protein